MRLEFMENWKINTVPFVAGALLSLTGSIAVGYGVPNVMYMLKMFLIDLLTVEKVDLFGNNDKGVRNESIYSIVVDYLSIVRPYQIDRSGHMNNSMYLYELNFSRRQFFNTLGFWRILKAEKVNMVIASQTIRYRRELVVFEKYNIQTRVVDINEADRSFFIESRFVTTNRFVAAIHYAKYMMVGKSCLTPMGVFQAAGIPAERCLSSTYHDSASGTEFVHLWETANAISSKALNPKKKSKSNDVQEQIINCL